MKFKYLFTISSLSAAFACSIATASETSIHKKYSDQLQKCGTQFGKEISIQRSHCLNNVSTSLGKKYAYPNMNLVHDVNKKRL